MCILVSKIITIELQEAGELNKNVIKHDCIFSYLYLLLTFQLPSFTYCLLGSLLITLV
jgi:hypothetical protein